MKLKLWKIKIYIISKEIFQYSLITYLILLFTETVKEGLVNYFFNFNILLAVVIFSGLIMVITYDMKLDLPTPPPKKIRYRDIFFSILLALGGGFFIFAGTFDLGIIAAVIGILATIIILILSLLLLTNKE